MKKIIIFLILLFSMQISLVYSQLSIETCQEKAKANYPSIKQYGLIEKTESYNLSNANKGYLPQLSASAKATYQSDVTSIPPINIPGLSGLKPMSKDQYQATAEINQTIWDGGAISSQNKITKASAEVDRQKTEVDLYTLKDRVNQLFFGILLLNEQLAQNTLLQEELQTNYDNIVVDMKNGVANQSDVDAIKVEQLKTTQSRIEIESNLKAYKRMLSAMIGENIAENQALVKPDIILAVDTTNNRPELKLYEAQRYLFSSQISSIKSGNMPKFGLFLQTGYGKPGLNMLKDDFTPFYIGGVTLSWNFSGFYTQKDNLRKIELSKQSVDIQKETFLYNTNLNAIQQSNEVQKIMEQIKSDKEIITLRNNIKKSAEVKVKNGTLSVTELIREIDDENLSIQDKSLHEMQLLLSIYNLKSTLNN